MAIDFDWNGRHWTARKVRRKLAWNEHRGVAHYDRERMRKPLLPISHPHDFQGWSTPLPSWIDPNWSAPDEVAPPSVGQLPADDLDDPPIAQTADYTLERCHVETVCQYKVWRNGAFVTDRRRAIYRWELTFTDGATFRFVSRAIAETAAAELLKIRKAKHPRPRYAQHSSESAAVYFTNRKLRTLTADPIPVDTAAKYVQSGVPFAA